MESRAIIASVGDMHDQEIAPTGGRLQPGDSVKMGGRLQPNDNVEMGGRIKDSEIEDIERPGGRLAKILQIHSASTKGL
jgi:hypothetical protein